MKLVHVIKAARKKDVKGYEHTDKNKKVMNTDCHFCGRQHQRNREHCPAFGKVCKLCKPKNCCHVQIE